MAAILESIIDGISALCLYNVQREMYVADCQIREKLKEYRQAVFRSSIQMQHSATVELARCKYKLEILRKRCDTLPENYKALFAPLCKDLEERIQQLRLERNKIARDSFA